jgi:hypothetical protein
VVCEERFQSAAVQAHLFIFCEAQITYICALAMQTEEGTCPFIEAGILSEVLGFVGPGHWIYLALVSKKWLEFYREVCSQFEKRFDLDRPVRQVYDYWQLDFWHLAPRPFEMSSTYTVFGATLGSSSRIRLAYRHGCNLQHVGFLRAAAELADKHTLLTAHELGMPHCEAVAAAARRGDREYLEWLLIHYHYGGCSARIVAAAAESGSVNLMNWLHSVGAVLRAASISTAAAKSGNVELCQYLVSLNCTWSEDALHEAVAHRHAEVFRWLQDNKVLYAHSYSKWRSVPPDTSSSMFNVYDAASTAEELEWLAGHSPLPSPTELTQLLNNAAAVHQLRVAQWYRERGAE